MECICHITVVLKWNYSCVLEEAMAEGFSTLAGELEARGSWKAAGTLRDLGHRMQIHHRGLHWKEYRMRNSSFLTSSLHRGTHWFVICNRFVICYILPGSWPQLFVIPTAGKQAVLPWEKHLERAFCALGEGNGRGTNKGISPSRLIVQGSALGRAKALEGVSTQCFIQDNCRDINPHLSLVCWGFLGNKSFVLNSNRTGVSPENTQRKRKSTRHHWMYFHLFLVGISWWLLSEVVVTVLEYIQVQSPHIFRICSGFVAVSLIITLK